MKKLLSVLLSFVTLNVAYAVPTQIYLAAPNKIEVIGERLKLTFKLPCKNKYPDEWAGQLVSASDDEGDMVISLGVTLSKGSCQKGPRKKFVFEYRLSEIGIQASELENGITFEPMDLAK
ncbi:MAG: hypothetical protein V4654_09625 [Bdellovibrionota bacterium]